MAFTRQLSQTYDLSLLEKSRDKWHRSAALREYYQSLFKDLLKRRIDGPTLELGSGCGFIKSVDPTVSTSDIETTPYSDYVVDAYTIGTLRLRWSNILAIDVLHHLRYPMDFFQSAADCLLPGGRIILCEPAATIWGNLFYRCCHHEPCDPENYTPPFEFETDQDGLFANMGAGWTLFEKLAKHTASRLSEIGLTLSSVVDRDWLAYPITGGFSKPALLPAFAVRAMLALEMRLPQTVLKRCGLRMVIKIEKE